jgi:hypothetical protein
MTASEASRPCHGTILVWEQWITHFSEGTCPECAALDGQWFLKGAGPHPPRHRNCRCQRKAVFWECIARPPDQAPQGSARGGPGSQSRPVGGDTSVNQ